MELYLLIAMGGVIIALLLILLLRKRTDGQPSPQLDKLAADSEDLRMRTEVMRSQLEQLQKLVADEFERSRRETGGFQKAMRDETAGGLEAMVAKLTQMTRENAEHQQKMTEALHASLNSIRTKNEEQLERMRETVDEKLTATLNSRLESSFKTVSEQLENLYKSLGEMKELSGGVTAGVTSLSRILTNVKARGTWAEIQLEGILDQTIPGMYEHNFTMPSSREQVEFAIKIPSGEAGEGGARPLIYLPVDSKFPMEDYIRLCDAADAADPVELARARKALEDQVLAEARAIRTKYIKPPHTTPYGILYLATEGLYAEIASSRSGILERIQNEFNIMIAGPATITALLNSLALGYRAVAINEKATEIHKLLSAVKVQYDKFTGLIDKAKKKIAEAGKTLDDVQFRNVQINKKLRTVEMMDAAKADELLMIPETEEDEEAE